MRRSSARSRLTATPPGEDAEKAAQDTGGPHRHDESRCASRHRQRDGLDEQQTNDAAAAGAQGQADRDLLPAAEAAREQQPGNVRRRDDQHERGGATQQRDNRAVPLLLIDPDAADLAYLDTTGERGVELVRQHGHLGLGLLNRHAIVEAADHADGVAATRQAIAVAVADAKHRGRDPHVVRRQAGEDAVESFRSNAHHGEGGPVDAHARAEDAGVRAEFRPPQVVAQHGDRIPAGHAILVRQEEPADRRLQAQEVEVVGGHHGAGDVEGTGRRDDVHGRRRVVRGQVGEHARVIAIVQVVGKGPGKPRRAFSGGPTNTTCDASSTGNGLRKSA